MEKELSLGDECPNCRMVGSLLQYGLDGDTVHCQNCHASWNSYNDMVKSVTPIRECQCGSGQHWAECPGNDNGCCG